MQIIPLTVESIMAAAKKCARLEHAQFMLLRSCAAHDTVPLKRSERIVEQKTDEGPHNFRHKTETVQL